MRILDKNYELFFLIYLVIYTSFIPLISQYSFVFFLPLTLLIFFIRKIKLSYYDLIAGLVLIVFSILYYSICAYYDLMFKKEISLDLPNSITICLTAFLVYYNSIIFAKSNKYSPFLIIPVIFGGFLIFANLSVYLTLKNDMVNLYMNRSAKALWYDYDIVGPSLGMLLSIGGSFLSSIYFEIKKRYKFILLVVSFLSLIATFLLQTRTPIYASFLSFTIATMIYFFRSNFLKKAFFIFALLGFTMVMVVAIENFSSDNRLELLLERYQKQGLNTPRYKRWKQAIVGITEYPSGGGRVNFYPDLWAHNFWLDIAVYAGVIPFFLVIFFHLLHFKKAFLAIFDKKYGYLYLAVSFSLFTSFFVEPLLIGFPGLFIVSNFYLGYINNLENDTKKVEA